MGLRRASTTSNTRQNVHVNIASAMTDEDREARTYDLSDLTTGGGYCPLAEVGVSKPQFSIELSTPIEVERKVLVLGSNSQYQKLNMRSCWCFVFAREARCFHRCNMSLGAAGPFLSL